jgi:hypothetical protein
MAPWVSTTTEPFNDFIYLQQVYLYDTVESPLTFNLLSDHK